MPTVWFVLPFILDPRGAATVAVVPGAMLAALALDKVVIPGLYRLAGNKQLPKPALAYASAPALIVVCVLSVYMLIMALYAAMELSRVVLTRPDREALAWVAANTPAASRFLVLTGETELFCDPLQEWFPVLTQRVSVATLQGHEWDRLGSFAERMAQSQGLQRCARASDPAACISDGTRIAGYNADYVFIPKQVVNKKLCRAQTGERSYEGLTELLEADGRFRLTFESPSASVFAVGEVASDPID